MKWISLVLAMLIAGSVWAAEQSAPPITGKVLEVKEAGTFTYLRLNTKEGELWAAVGRAEVKTGTEVTIEGPMYMSNFESKALGRKFDRIVLGSLKGAKPVAHGMGGSMAGGMAGGMPAGHPPVPATPDQPVVKVTKASAPDAQTVEDVNKRSADLKDKKVTVRARVAKVTLGVMDKNWIHVRDGSGNSADKSDDLLLTTRDTAAVGDIVVARGVVRTDKNFGSGYAYKVLVEDASLQK